jgi:chromosome segregation ATPase
MSEPCVKSDKIDRLGIDVVNINERLNRHSEKIDKISDNNLVLETILKRLEEDGKEQKSVNKLLNESMLSIQSAMTEITFNIRELNTGLTNTNKKVHDMDVKISTVDNKSKIDIWEAIKSKVVPFLFGGGCIYGIIELIKYFVK